MNIHLLDQAENDLVDGYNFYENQEQGVGGYFLDSLYSDIESLVLYAGIHRTRHKNYRRMLSKRFPFAIYYTISGDKINVHAVIGCRKDPAWIIGRLDL
ncbi:MAG: type II toxin-antitoxin system RelE/ParE family toxin [Candidatus Anammoxibacter sp.]